MSLLMRQQVSQKFDATESDFEMLEYLLVEFNFIMAQSSSQTTYEATIRNLAEVIDPLSGDSASADAPQLTQLQTLLQAGPVRCYWGTAPTGKPHLGYLVPLIKIIQMQNLGYDMTILLADLHAMMDDGKSSQDVIVARTQFYHKILSILLHEIELRAQKQRSVHWRDLKFVVGETIQLTPKYMTDMLMMMSKVTLKAAQHAGSEVVKQNKDPRMSSLAYPIMQMLDEEHLHCDVELGGVDQRKLFMFSRQHCGDLGYKKRIYLMNPLIPGLTKTGKMSSSEPLSKVDFDDTDDTIREKLAKCFSVDGKIEGNGLVAIIKYILFELFPAGLSVPRKEEYGGDLFYATYEAFEADFLAKKVGSVDIKPAVATHLIEFITPIRQQLAQLAELIKKAYPISIPLLPVQQP
jgi:tyrosyl-tRNA synthetase